MGDKVVLPSLSLCKCQMLNDTFQHGVWLTVYILESLCISTIDDAVTETRFIVVVGYVRVVLA